MENSIALNFFKKYWLLKKVYQTLDIALHPISRHPQVGVKKENKGKKKKKNDACVSFFDPILGICKSDETLPLVFDILHDGLHDGVLVHHILWSSQWHNTPWKPALNWRYHHTLIEPKTIMGLQLDFCWEREWKNTCQMQLETERAVRQLKVQNSFGSFHHPLRMKGWPSVTRKEVRQKRSKQNKCIS